jgi:hypothetical protein
MCLTIMIVARRGDRTRLESAAASLPTSALQMEVRRESRLPSPRERPVRASVSEAGGCACSLLADDANWDAPFWTMRPEILEPLARTFTAITARGVSEFHVEASWGDAPLEERDVSPGEMFGLARAGRIGTRTRYLVRGAATD